MTNRKKMQMLEVEPGCFVCGPPEWVEGAERRLVPTTRSEEGPEDAEQRSAEGSAVPPGEARAIVNTIHALTKKASEAKEGKAEADGWGAECMSALFQGRLEALSWAVQELLWALPEPDSEAGIDLTPFYDLPAPFIPRGRESPQDERSGRRNVNADRSEP